MKIVLKTIKFILLAALVIMLAALAFVLITERDPAAMKQLAWTQEAADAYKAAPDGFRVKSVTGFNDRTYSQDGAVGVSMVTHVTDLDEWQILVRYNDSTLKSLTERYGAVDYPDTERFIFTLSDDLGNVYTKYHFVTAETRRHNYVRVVFDGVPLSFKEGSTVKRVKEMQLNVYLREDANGGELPDNPVYFAYIFSDNASQYDYERLEKELPDGKATEGIRSSEELY